jgi:hypothetical protein
MASTNPEYVQFFFIALAIFVIYNMFFKESFEEVQGDAAAQEPATEQPVAAPQEPAAPASSPIAEAPSPIAQAPQLRADELLPKYDEANEFAQQNPVSELLKEQNFLISGYHMGVNTTVSSNKIPYHDLRAAPPIPKQTIGPFLQSSYETPAGTNRRSLTIL